MLAVGRSHDMPEESFGPVMGRKNDYGRVSLVGLLFSLFQMWGVSLRSWLMAYLEYVPWPAAVRQVKWSGSCRGTSDWNNAAPGTAE